ncbi:MAG: CDP-alcohol phosphatidyltransferase family protein [Actinomycetota bacterium]|nr:CDP-alcohol phosphatidyltransferase family protein [Actinomycetota bacterium]
MLDVVARSGAARVVDPIGRRLARLGLTPTWVTLVGLGVTVAGSVMVASGRLLAGALIIVAGSALDALDGAVARAAGEVTPGGAVVDSVADRIGETAMWGGLSYHLAGQPVAVALCVVALGTSFLIPYLRSRAEAEGLAGKGGLMGRAERVILYSAGVASGWVLPMLWVMLALTVLTILQRFRLLWAQLSG